MEQKRDFDALAATWDDNPGRLRVTRAIADAMLREVPFQSDMAMMDYGAGTGLVTLALQPHAASVVAVDSSAGMLGKLDEKLAAAELSNVTTLQCDLEQSDWTGEPLDLIVSSMTIHHIGAAALVVKKLGAALKQGGWLAIADLDAESVGFHPDPTGVFHHGFGAEEMQSMFTAAGLGSLRTVEALRMERETGEFAVLLTVGQK
jgi:predicted TPR repeat methyltransferase